jgi:putative tricarboxylic transport membrane protein
VLGFASCAAGTFPVAPAVIGLILGPLAESQLRRAMAISQGDPSVFVTQPIALGLLLATVLVLLVPPVVRALQRRRARAAA